MTSPDQPEHSHTAPTSATPLDSTLKAASHTSLLLHSPQVDKCQQPLEVICDELTLRISKQEPVPEGKPTGLFRRVPQHTVERNLLDGVSVCFRPGRLTAIMGASGAGKTTLLNCLAGEAAGIKGAQLSGTISVNGQPVSGRRLKRLSGFVFQDDVLLETMTVREAISMSASLRLPKAMGAAERAERVEEVIRMLNLEAAADTKIGSPLRRGISGGERKRCAIAMEIITNPAMLFLDEPTSGLDTFTSFTVVSRLQALAHEAGRTVVATVHQPSSETFHLFDDLLLLSEGRVVYAGPVSEAVAYFAALGHQCPAHHNPADYFFMEILNDPLLLKNDGAVEKRERQASLSQRLRELQAAWAQSPEHKALRHRLQASSQPEQTLSSALLHEKEMADFGRQFAFLLGRWGRAMLRNFMLINLRFLRAVMMGLIIGLIFWDLPAKQGYAQFQDRTSALFFLLNNEMMGVASTMILVFSVEKTVFHREYQAGYYGLPAYYLSKAMVEVPFGFIGPIITVGIAYYMVGFRSGINHFLICLGTQILVGLVSSGLGLTVAALLKDVQAAMALFPMIILPLMIFGGLMINLKNVPVWFRWLPHISPLKHAFTASAKNEFTGVILPNCTPGPGYPCTGDEILRLLALDTQPSIWVSWVILLGMWAFLMLTGYLCLVRISRARSLR